jgi:hypothetical protein
MMEPTALLKALVPFRVIIVTEPEKEGNTDKVK